VNRAWPAVAAAVLCGAAWGQAPVYSAAGIVNASDFSAGPFAPNSVLSLFGANLSFGTAAVTTASIEAATLPTQLADVGVYVDNQAAPLLFVSAGQINFLVPSNETPHAASLQVVRQGITGPAVSITLLAAAPALFTSLTDTPSLKTPVTNCSRRMLRPNPAI